LKGLWKYLRKIIGRRKAMYEDYGDYYEPTLAEEIFEEAKARLEQALRKDVKRDVEKSLDIVKNQEIRKVELDDRERKIYFKEKELERKFNDLENEFAKKKLGEFIAMLQKYLGQTYYKVDSFGEYAPKCDACNDKRMLDVTLPDGSIKTIGCSCNKYIYRFRVIEKSMIGITIEKDGSRQKIWLKYNDYSDEIESVYSTLINEKFEDVKDKKISYKLFYTNKEEAQKHVDYLNELKG